MRARKKGKPETGKEGGSWRLGRGYGGGEPDKGYQCLSTLLPRDFLSLFFNSFIRDPTNNRVERRGKQSLYFCKTGVKSQSC
jgi:hypothetical protein